MCMDELRINESVGRPNLVVATHRSGSISVFATKCGAEANNRSMTGESSNLVSGISPLWHAGRDSKRTRTPAYPHLMCKDMRGKVRRFICGGSLHGHATHRTPIGSATGIFSGFGISYAPNAHIPPVASLHYGSGALSIPAMDHPMRRGILRLNSDDTGNE